MHIGEYAYKNWIYMKKLLIVESPAKIKTITKFLGKDFKIMSTVGHIKDLPSRSLGITMPDKGAIELEYVPMKDKEKVISEICREASKADEVFLAPDPDREGEIIAWHIGQEIAKVFKNKEKIYRITFNEITKPAIASAIEHPSSINMEKVAAQQARRVLDRWVGYEVSPVLWRKIAKGLSAGRVQSVALKLICDREIAIREFKPEEYWSIEGLFKQGRASLSAQLTHIKKKTAKIGNQKEVDALTKELTKSSFKIESITDKTRAKNPNPPFMTSTLQQAAFNRLGFAVKRTMELAQRLYEGIPLSDPSTPVALITYMRTDSLRLSETALNDSRAYIEKTFGKDYLPTSVQVYGKGQDKAQDAHEAIRPVDVSITPEMVKPHIPADAAKLYELIWQRAVACQMKPAQYAQRQVVIEGGDYTFKVTGSTLIFDGFLKVYADDDEKEEKVTIPKTLKAQEAVELAKLEPKQHFTQAPPRYTEASLVKDLEKEGVGRPSTYASILNTIRARAYTSMDTKKRFVPTELGMRVTEMLTQHLPKIMNVKFTAHMEEDLDKIAAGDLQRDTLLREFYGEFKDDLDKFRGTDTRAAQVTELVCPACSKNKLAIRFGKAGEFIGCTGFPECSFTSNFTQAEDGTIQLVQKEEPALLDEVCPQCKKNKLRTAVGRYGPFTACSGYPECKYIHQTKAQFACPLDKGEVVQRTWRGGKFWGCANYPKCKFAVFGDIEATPCPQCKLPFLVKKTGAQGTESIRCWSKECGYAQE